MRMKSYHCATKSKTQTLCKRDFLWRQHTGDGCEWRWGALYAFRTRERVVLSSLRHLAIGVYYAVRASIRAHVYTHMPLIIIRAFLSRFQRAREYIHNLCQVLTTKFNFQLFNLCTTRCNTSVFQKNYWSTYFRDVSSVHQPQVQSTYKPYLFLTKFNQDQSRFIWIAFIAYLLFTFVCICSVLFYLMLSRSACLLVSARFHVPSIVLFVVEIATG